MVLLFLVADGRPQPPAPPPEPEILAEQPPEPEPEPPPELFRTEFSTRYLFKQGSADRAHNIGLAVSKLDGVRLEPGQEFSFNRSVGERTAEAGFKEATAFFEGVRDQQLGGGICQVSSTLYSALMHGGFKIVERHPHSRKVPYLPRGMDAAVNWPDLDLKFVNDTDGLLTIRIRTEEKGDEMEMTAVLESVSERPRATGFWSAGPLKDFGTRYIESPYVKSPRRTQKGLPGKPGFRFWKYGDRTVRVWSNYKPVIEVMVIPEGWKEDGDERGAEEAKAPGGEQEAPSEKRKRGHSGAPTGSPDRVPVHTDAGRAASGDH